MALTSAHKAKWLVDIIRTREVDTQRKMLHHRMELAAASARSAVWEEARAKEDMPGWGQNPYTNTIEHESKELKAFDAVIRNYKELLDFVLNHFLEMIPDEEFE